MDRGSASAWWTDHDGLGGGSPELSLAAAPGHSGLPRGWQHDGGDVVRLGDCSPELGWRRGGGAPTAGLRLQAATVRVRMRRGGGEVKW
jgi:hypothetical protein